MNEFVSWYTGYKPNNVCPTMYVSPCSCCGEDRSSVHLYLYMYVRGFVRQGFNSVPEGASVTDTDRAATLSFITESSRINCSLHAKPDILEDDNQCISFTLQFVPERHVHLVSLGERVQTETDPFGTC